MEGKSPSLCMELSHMRHALVPKRHSHGLGKGSLVLHPTVIQDNNSQSACHIEFYTKILALGPFTLIRPTALGSIDPELVL